MVAVTYPAFCDRMIHRYEGGYCWDRGDPGGPTKYGITCFDLAEHRGQRMDSMARWAPIVRAMTLQEAEDIYKIKYARRLRYDDLRAGCDTVIFDYGVNSGIARPIRVSRKLFNMDGRDVMTDLLVEKINKADPKWFIDAMCAERLHFMHAIKGGAMWRQFGKGWGARVNDLEGYSEHLAVGSTAPIPPDLSKVPTPKAKHVGAGTNSGTVGTAGSAGAGAAVHAIGLPTWAIATAVGVGVVGTAAYIVWSQQQAALANKNVIIPASVPPHP